MKEPIRLCDGDELPSALRDAFRELTREAPSAEVVARVQGALHALPAAAPGALAVGALSTGKLLTLATLLVTAGASVALLSNHGTTRPATRSVAQTAPIGAQTAAPSATADTAATSRSAALEAESTTAASPRNTGQAAAPSEPSPARQRALVRGDARRSERHAPARVTARAHGPSNVGQDEVLAPKTASGSEPARVSAEPAASEEPAAMPSAPVPGAAADQAAEARLLAQAKRHAARDPAAALREVEALAAQFPDGVFAQERSLLAIQLHRQLGHTALAERLARQFQERYPRSFYRRALPP